MGGIKAAVQRLAADFKQFFRFPAIPAKEGDCDTEVARLTDDQRALSVVSGHEDRFDPGGLDRGELGPKILVALGVFLFHRDGAAALSEGFAEELREPDAVGVRDAGNDRHLGGLQVIAGEFGHDRALKRVDETHAEDVVAHLGDLRIGGGGGDHGDAGGLGDRRRLEGAAGRNLTEQGDHLVAGDQFFGDRGRFARPSLVVLGNKFQFLTEHAPGLVQLLERHGHALVGGLAETRLLAGERGIFADLYRFALLGAGGEEERGGGEEGANKFFHGERRESYGAMR